MLPLTRDTPEFFDGEVVKCASAPGLSVGEIQYPAACERPRHAHERACFHFLFEGAYTEYWGRRSRECKTLTLAFQPQGHEHSYCCSPEPSRALTIELENAWVANLRDYSLKLDEAGNFYGGSVSWLITKLYHEFRAMETASILVIEALALEIAVEISRQKQRLSTSPPPLWMKQAMELIHARFAESLSLQTIAQSVGIHPVHLARVFRKQHHLTVGEYLRRLRVEFASQQMINSNSPLVEIALAAGFSDQSQFSNTFKRATGLTPAQFRSQLRGR
jgi:AraC family transcriptional regulator